MVVIYFVQGSEISFPLLLSLLTSVLLLAQEYLVAESSL